MYKPPNNLSLWFRFQFLSAFLKTSKGVLVDIALCAAIWALGRSALKGGYSSVVSPSKKRRKRLPNSGICVNGEAKSRERAKDGFGGMNNGPARPLKMRTD